MTSGPVGCGSRRRDGAGESDHGNDSRAQTNEFAAVEFARRGARRDRAGAADGRARRRAAAHPAGSVARRRDRRPGFRVGDAGRRSRVLTRSTAEQARPDTAGQERTATAWSRHSGHFGVQAKVIGTVAGPHITRYELRLAPGTKVGKVAQLKDDLAYALAATDIRILAPIPGKQAVGVEVPEREAADGAPRRRLPGAARGLVAADGVAGQGRRGQGDRGGPREDAPPARRGHDGRGQVGRDQRDALQRAAARDPARTAPRAGGPEAGGAQPLRVDPASAHARDHEPADGRQRIAEPRARDGAALRDHVAVAHAQPDRAQPARAKHATNRRCLTSCA